MTIYINNTHYTSFFKSLNHFLLTASVLITSLYSTLAPKYMLLDPYWHPTKFPEYYHLVTEFKHNIPPFPVWRSEKSNVPFQCLPFPMKLVSTTKYHYLISSDSLASAKIPVSCRNIKASSTVLQTYRFTSYHIIKRKKHQYLVKYFCKIDLFLILY